MMNQFTCDYFYYKEHEVTGNEPAKKPCTKEIYGDEANAILPQNLPMDYHTQKLLHYTLVF